jgi:putative tryptophan/tyrosine transport system substrate-binding protein
MVEENKKKIWVGIILVLALVLLLIAGFLFFLGSNKQEEKVYHVGILAGITVLDEIIDGFKEGMAELGYVEGKNIIYDIKKFDNDPPEEKKAAEKFVEERDDLIFSYATGTTLIAKEATKGTNISLVFAIGDTEQGNLINNIRQPGGHITGIRDSSRENTIKRLEMLHEIAPNAKRICVVYEKNYPNNVPVLESLRPAASFLGVSLVEIPVTDAEGIKTNLEARDKLDRLP